MKSTSKRVIPVRLPQALVAKLQTEAKRQGVEIGTLIRRAVAADLRRAAKGGQA